MREKKLKTLEEIVDSAEAFVEAHGGEISSKRQKVDHQPRHLSSKKNMPANNQKVQSHIPRGPVPIEERMCYNCGDKGHMAKNCTKPAKRDDRMCYLCNHKGHIAKNCSYAFNKTPKVAAVALPETHTTQKCVCQVQQVESNQPVACSCLRAEGSQD